MLTAEPLIIDAYTETVRRNALERLDPLTETVTPGMRRADALLALVNQHAQQQLAPSVGGDRPRVVVTIAHGHPHRSAIGAETACRGL